jgi:hypothetical protein
MQMIDVLTKLREIADRSPEEIGRAIAAAEKMSGQAPVSEASEAQKAAREKFKNMLKGKKDDDKDEDKGEDKKTESKGKKPDYLDFDKDGDKKEPMTKALKDKEDKKVDEDVQITLSGSDAVLAEILKLAGQIGAKTTKGADTGPSMPGSTGGLPALPPPAPSGMPSSGPIPSLASMLGDKPDHMGGPDHMDGPMGGPDHMDGPMGGGMEDEILGDSFNAATTTPNPTTMGVSSAVPSGNDLAKPKVTTPMTSPGNNPLHTAISFD